MSQANEIVANSWAFLKSNRFYGNVIISVGYWFQQADPFTLINFGKFLVVLGGLFVAIRTIDRFGENLKVDKVTLK